MNILVVDDTKALRIFLTKCLELKGHSISTASNGEEALNLINLYSFDLIFLDIKMPYLSGTEVLKSIRKINIGTPVIIITAYGSIKNAVDCTNLGAVSYLQKPFTAEKIYSVLNELPLGNLNSSLEFANLENSINANPSNALIIIKKSIASDPTNPIFYLYLSKVYRALGFLETSDKFLKIYNIML